MHRKPAYFLLLAIFLCIPGVVWSLDISVTGLQQINTKDALIADDASVPEINFSALDSYTQSQEINISVLQDFDPSADELLFLTDFSYNTDDKYSPPMGGRFYSGYFLLEEGGLKFSRNQEESPLEFSIGRFKPAQVIDSPYSLFVSSAENSTITANIYLENEYFFFRSQWLQLNHNSTAEAVPENIYTFNEDTDDEKEINFGFGASEADEDASGFPDRGANLRYYGLKLNNYRFGVFDGTVYYGRSFDLEYFLNPLPSIILQYATIDEGTPWRQNQDGNALLGLFFDYRSPSYYIYSQFFFDDINVHMFFNPEEYVNPNKLAWSVGGNADLSWGSWGFYHAGATRYTFQPTYSHIAYGYTYYPDTLFLLENGDTAGIPFEDNYIGYKYGENNLAFLFTLKPNLDASPRSSKFLDDLELAGSLEFVLSGIKSPVNPWSEYTYYKQGGLYTKMFTHDTLEKRLLFTLEARKTVKKSQMAFFGKLEIGYVWNKLMLVPGLSGDLLVDYEENEKPYDKNSFDPDNTDFDLQYLHYFEPSDISEPIARLTIGIEYSFDPIKTFF